MVFIKNYTFCHFFSLLLRHVILSYFFSNLNIILWNCAIHKLNMTTASKNQKKIKLLKGRDQFLFLWNSEFNENFLSIINCRKVVKLLQHTTEMNLKNHVLTFFTDFFSFSQNRTFFCGIQSMPVWGTNDTLRFNKFSWIWVDTLGIKYLFVLLSQKITVLTYAFHWF